MNECPKCKDEIERLQEREAKLIEALKSMLHIFDRGLPNPSIGRRVCDEAKEAIDKAEKSK